MSFPRSQSTTFPSLSRTTSMHQSNPSAPPVDAAKPLTRSMSRKSISTSSSFATTSSSSIVSAARARRATLATSGSLADLAVASPRKVLSDTNARDNGKQRARTASAAKGLSGMGVRVGPAVHAPRSPHKPLVAGKTTDPFSTGFRADAIVEAARAGEGRKMVRLDYGGDENSRMSMSPPKRTDSGTTTTTKPGSRPFDLTSPSKPSAHTSFPAHSVPSHLAIVPRSPTKQNTLPSSPLLPSSRKHKSAATSDGSDDDIDFLSPRKRVKSTGHETLPPSKLQFTSMEQDRPISGPRSPPKRRPVVEVLGPTSVPMSRVSYALPPPRRVFAAAPLSSLPADLVSPLSPPSRFHSPTTMNPFSSTTTVISNGSIDPRILSLPPPALSSITTNGIPSRYTGPTTWRSGIPRLAVKPLSSTAPAHFAVPPIPSYAPRPSISSSIGTDIDTSSTTSFDREGDVTMATTDEANESIDVGNTSGMSEATASRLANLQKMLSRLSMPRQSVGGVAVATTKVEGNKRQPAFGPESVVGRHRAAISSLANTVPTQRRSTIGGGTGYEEYSVPLSSEKQSKIAPSSMFARSRGQENVRPTTTGTTQRLPPPAMHQDLASKKEIRAPRRTSVLSSSVSTATISAISEGEVSSKPRNNVLKGVVAYVDVRTLEGDDAGMIFVDMLKSMGARVTTGSTLTLTHIVYKSGRPQTLHRFRSHPDPKPYLVGISWVVRCAEIGQRVDEGKYAVECGKEPTFQKRRRSMEPKALASLGGPMGGGGTTVTDPTLKATIAASIERARRRSLQFAPKIGSPLAKRRYMMLPQAPEEDEEMS